MLLLHTARVAHTSKRILKPEFTSWLCGQQNMPTPGPDVLLCTQSQSLTPIWSKCDRCEGRLTPQDCKIVGNLDLLSIYFVPHFKIMVCEQKAL